MSLINHFSLFLIVSAVCSSPLQNSASIDALGLDFIQAVSSDQMHCIKSYGTKTVFLRAYAPFGEGQVDVNSVNNARLALSLDMAVEIFMDPQPTSSKSGAQQLSEVYETFHMNELGVVGVWLKVTEPSIWSTNIQSNLEFIKSVQDQAKAYGIYMGIYTGVGDWTRITRNWTGGISSSLWYYNTTGYGLAGETSPTLNDYQQISTWTSPSVKQYGQIEAICQVLTNKNVYRTASAEVTSRTNNMIGSILKAAQEN